MAAATTPRSRSARHNATPQLSPRHRLATAHPPQRHATVHPTATPPGRLTHGNVTQPLIPQQRHATAHPTATPRDSSAHGTASHPFSSRHARSAVQSTTPPRGRLPRAPCHSPTRFVIPTPPASPLPANPSNHQPQDAPFAESRDVPESPLAHAGLKLPHRNAAPQSPRLEQHACHPWKSCSPPPVSKATAHPRQSPPRRQEPRSRPAP